MAFNLDLPKKYTQCEETIKKLQNIIELGELKREHLESNLEIKNNEQRETIKQLEEKNKLINQQNETIADLREFIAKRIGLEALDAFDTQVRDIDLLLEQVNDQYEEEEDDDDETTDGRSDPIIPFQNEYFSIDNNLYRQEQNYNSIEYQENIPPSPINYPPSEKSHYSSPENSLHNNYTSPSPVEYEQPFVEAVRKKEERKKLTGTTCKCCADYYYAAGNLPGPDGTIITPEERIQQCSRHRSRFKRPKTPPGFWNLDFISTQDVEGQYNEQKERMEE
ncbi:hypothetical protein INT45_005835 [Circinella minor]|uniref:DNA endonuclease activator Ctp1 C-terminal domain-containing protein n=1 Tax=Circinella minor TaxID=1195481 RepID=A0A8H7RWH9_9FUNG|nr:hypothetical protein INT45_005835 [Circinella minor]